MLRHVFTELRLGLRRNVSMHVAVILTLFVCLTMVGVGLLAKAEADKASKYWGSQLQITVWLCNFKDDTGNCSGEITDEQRAAILRVIDDSPEVQGVEQKTKQDAFDSQREFLSPERFEQTSAIVPVEEYRDSIWITLNDPEQFEGVTSAVVGLDGVQQVTDLRRTLERIYAVINAMRYGALGIATFLVVAALLLVANTIRLAAMARRREIAIMRLVGASSLYISLPFLLEALVTAMIAVGLSAGAMALILREGVMNRLSELEFIPWVGWPDYFQAMAYVALLGPLLTIIPTLLLTRKYLKV